MHIQPCIFFTIVIVLLSCQNSGPTPDNDFDVTVADPQLINQKPRVCFDQGHKNHHKVKKSYRPFAVLLKNDGCVVESNEKTIEVAILSNADIYIINTAMGVEDPGDKSPFSESEISILEGWVNDGGSVLIITEHYPFGLAMKPLLNKFGVDVHNGYLEDSTLVNKNVRDALLFEKSKGNLSDDHPITANVEKVNTFTGTSIKGDSTWTPLLILSNQAQNYNVDVKVERDGGDTRANVTYSDFYPATGFAQGICRKYGKGKVVILGESALLTAQFDRDGNKFGMNVPDTDNKQFALNIIRWLVDRDID